MNFNIDRKIILASKSPRRKELLEQMNLNFEIVTSEVNEEELMKTIKSPKNLVAKLSSMKAEAVSKLDMIESEHLIIAADTIVVYKREVFGKPKDELDAMRMLKLLNGTKHYVYTGMTIIDMKNMTKKTIVEKVKVYFNKVSDDVIMDYVKSGEPLDKAGAYAIQECGKIFVDKIKGDYYSVIGLPVNKLFCELFKLKTTV